MLKKTKKANKITIVTEREHEKWHKKQGGCGDSKEHDACMKKWGIKIVKKNK
jgi:hypothetical protein